MDYSSRVTACGASSSKVYCSKAGWIIEMQFWVFYLNMLYL